MNPLKELNTIVSDIITADGHDRQLEAGQRLIAYTVCEAIDRECRKRRETRALLPVLAGMNLRFSYRISRTKRRPCHV